ncbi:hypothetical protein V6N11_045439 [Hibiscus sabdariffa]|uniref:Uncharacterized protein n=1 Tax=Hibiscus sabdariffa TaxID=183260 RepID=A0ABR2Q0Y7_9ROSI
MYGYLMPGGTTPTSAFIHSYTLHNIIVMLLIPNRRASVTTSLAASLPQAQRCLNPCLPTLFITAALIPRDLLYTCLRIKEEFTVTAEAARVVVIEEATCAGWRAPALDWVKPNVDGAVGGNWNMTAVGGVICGTIVEAGCSVLHAPLVPAWS